MTRRSLVRFNDIKTDLREMLSGGFGRVARDGAEAVGFGGFLGGFDNGATLGAGRADDGEQEAKESCVIVMGTEMRGAVSSRQ
ncbi:hypothetical protein NliqN6_5952 [Naganishia liquefaciens]|uniref:Uncharacterized protein n=1 Tax=Naganishia liquefaciens TaxID=104408 RepID=A0A8H3TZ62_9TREE|nr:hypothetical protein NliqN6_5952 [Naganishia liquefaciens]